MERAIFFIDGNNLRNALKECYNLERLDLEPFCKYIALDRQIKNIYYADANFLQDYGSNNYARQQAYFKYIRGIKNLVFRQGYYRKWNRKPIEKLSDVYLATDMVDLCYRDEYDIAYLVSGDADLGPAVDIVTRQGKKVTNVYVEHPVVYRTIPKQRFRMRNSYALRKHCQGYFKNITKKIAEEFKWEYKKKPEPEGSGGHKSQ